MSSHAYAIRPGDTLTALAARYSTSVKTLTALNKLTDPNKLKVGQVIQVPDVFAGPTHKVTVKAGQTLSAVAREAKTTVAQLVAMNDLADPNKLQVGQVLVVPTAETAKPVVTGARCYGSGAVYADINGAERLIAPHGVDPKVVGGRYVVFIMPGEGRNTVGVFDAHTNKLKNYPVPFDNVTGVSGFPTSNGQFALVAEGTSGARGVPVVAVLHPDKGVVFSPEGSASLASVKGDEISIQTWDRKEGEYEVSPTKIHTFDLRQLLTVA